MKATKQLRYRTRRLGAVGPAATTDANGEVDAVRLAGDIAAFESATGVPHDPIAVGMFVVIGAVVREIAAVVRAAVAVLLRRR